MNTTRRQLLCRTLGLSASAVFTANNASAKPADVAAAIKEIAAGSPVGEGRITLKTPGTAENSNSIPVSVTVESPMTKDSYVESVAIFAEGNQKPEVITFNFTPASGEAYASTRIRLTETQNVVAVAKMNDGSFFSASSPVEVGTGSCAAEYK